jgi:hypothetical protein
VGVEPCASPGSQSHRPRANLRRNRVILLVQDLDVRVVHAITGEVLRELTIDPDKDYQPRTPK